MTKLTTDAKHNLRNNREQIVHLAIKTLAQNKECYIAQWIIQNPDKRIEDYTLCEQNDWAGGVRRFWIEEKI